MKTLAIFLTALALTIIPAAAGTWMISNSKGFSSNPVVDAAGTPLSGLDPVIVAVGTFASQPLAVQGATLASGQYAALLAEFTGFGPQVALVTPGSPLNLHGVFDFQHDGTVLGTPLAGRPVYLIIAKGATLAAATEVAILRTNATFDAAEDENALPRQVGVGVTLGTTVIAGSGLRHTASATSLDPTLDPAYSLAALVADPDIVVEQPAGTGLTDNAATLAFGNGAVGVPGTSLSLKIRNTGNTDLTGIIASLTGGDAASFGLDASGLATVLSPGQDTGFSVRFTPQHSGPISATLLIASNDPDENPFEIALTGTGYPLPVASFIASPNPAGPGQMVAFDASASTPSAGLVSYAWNWGDGSPGGSGVTSTHSYAMFGSYVVTLTVTDSLGQTATTTTPVAVSQGNYAPLANPGGPYLIGAGQSVTFNGSGSTDPNISYGDSLVSYEWDVNNDGTYDVAGPMPTVTWAALVGYGISATGSHPVRLRVTDTFGATDVGTATLTVDAIAPTLSLPPNLTVPATGGTGAIVTFSATATDNLDPAPGRPDFRHPPRWDLRRRARDSPLGRRDRNLAHQWHRTHRHPQPHRL